jgi:hypothetical protein
MARDKSAWSDIRAMTALVIIGTFLSGALTGAGVYHWFVPHRSHPLHHPGAPPLAELGLNAEQESKAKAIMDAHRAELEAILHDTFPKVRAVHERIDNELRAILTVDQRQRFDRWKSEHPEHRGPGGSAGPDERDGRDGPGGPHGSGLGPSGLPPPPPNRP